MIIVVCKYFDKLYAVREGCEKKTEGRYEARPYITELISALNPLEMVKSTDKIQIIGGGTFGLSTAFYLAKAGYKDIIVIDREEVPSSFSAGYDLNKIVRPEYEDQFYTDLALDSIELWESDEFKDYFRKLGYVNCHSGNAPEKSVNVTKQFYNILKSNERLPEGTVLLLQTEADFKAILPQLDIDFKGWSGYFNRQAGYAKALKAMEHITLRCKEMGVKFVVDRIQDMVYSHKSKTCLGVLGELNTFYPADITIIAMGAHVTSIFPELHQYVTPQCWSVGHLQLTEAEAKKLDGVPVVNCRDIGFFFEPAEGNILKMCNLSPGWSNFIEGTNVSVPTESNDGVCLIDEELLKAQTEKFFPNVLSKTLIDKKICWCCDRGNSDYVIDYHPDYNNLFFATADSGHAFKMFPIFGKWVLEKLEGTLSPEKADRWAWFKTADGAVDEVTWRLGKVMDLKGQERN